MTLTIGLHAFLTVAALLFVLGMICVLTRRNAIGLLMGVELILNSANINLVAFSRFVENGLSGQIFALFVIVLAAAEAAIAMAIVLAIYRSYKNIDVNLTVNLKE
ncbi:MAG TPA: NADH-quinone oxidoreductase subunit NuoK [bacterium]|nr:NADH-quinone oxidoreductase subunit NuoK [bacterium]HQG44278.1 NADH-quinone oxidoreductase subunit NuoK [bacterium]HQI48558.1 NADH-quinone oxidoreductase subunit NuoK [bacterium]HQJ63663.1 NADH-quinone oxidoreductase subunit NuoK [bacterium]